MTEEIDDIDAQNIDALVHAEARMTRPAQGDLLLRPAGTWQQIVDAVEAYEEIKRRISRPDDFQETPQGRFPKRQWFTRMAMAFAISTKRVDQRLDYEDGHLVGAETTVRATAFNGRYTEGIGYCSIDEPRFMKPGARQKAHHDLVATAYTRARNRAIGDMLPGGNVVSWEEVDAGTPEDERVPDEKPTRPQTRGQLDPNQPALTNQVETINKLYRLLGTPEAEQCDAKTLSQVEAGKVIMALNRQLAERKKGT